MLFSFVMLTVLLARFAVCHNEFVENKYKNFNKKLSKQNLTKLNKK